MTDFQDLLDLTKALRGHLVSHRRTDLPIRRVRSAKSPEPVLAPPETVHSETLIQKNSLHSEKPAAPPLSLEGLREKIGDCHICPLGDTRQKLVFGVGNPKAKVMVIGEGPGFMEDRVGEPFVGPAGQLLDKILQAVELSRNPCEPAWKWVYIANIVKCHPMVDPSQPEKRGNDRAPEPEEIEKCIPFLREQVSLIQPAIILALGATASKALLNTSRGISAIRGQWFDYKPAETGPAVKLMPTYHPAALLRNPDLKRDVWADIKLLKAALQEKIQSS
jgi:uracil-DNA glycosylase